MRAHATRHVTGRALHVASAEVITAAVVVSISGAIHLIYLPRCRRGVIKALTVKYCPINCNNGLILHSIDQVIDVQSGGSLRAPRFVLSRADSDHGSKHCHNAGLMLGQRLRPWPNIKPALGDRVRITMVSGTQWDCQQIPAREAITDHRRGGWLDGRAKTRIMTEKWDGVVRMQSGNYL